MDNRIVTEQSSLAQSEAQWEADNEEQLQAQWEFDVAYHRKQMKARADSIARQQNSQRRREFKLAGLQKEQQHEIDARELKQKHEKESRELQHSVETEQLNRELDEEDMEEQLTADGWRIMDEDAREDEREYAREDERERAREYERQYAREYAREYARDDEREYEREEATSRQSNSRISEFRLDLIEQSPWDHQREIIATTNDPSRLEISTNNTFVPNLANNDLPIEPNYGAPNTAHANSERNNKKPTKNLCTTNFTDTELPSTDTLEFNNFVSPKSRLTAEPTAAAGRDRNIEIINVMAPQAHHNRVEFRNTGFTREPVIQNYSSDLRHGPEHRNSYRNIEQRPQNLTPPQTLHVTSSTVNGPPQRSNSPRQLSATTPTSLSDNTNGNIQLPFHLIKADLRNLNIPIFNGSDPTCFKGFLKSFQSAIENTNASDSDKFALLERITADEALSIVQAHESDNQVKALTDAIAELTICYADPYKYANAIHNKVSAYPPINDETDGKAMATFSRFLRRQLNMSENNVMAIKALNGPLIMSEIANKLPNTTRLRLTQGVRKRIKKMVKAEVGLQEVIDFLNDESDRFDSSGIEVIFGTPRGVRTNDPRPAAKVMTISASSGAQLSVSTRLPTNHTRSAHPPRQVNNPQNFANNVHGPNPNRAYCQFCDRQNHDITACTRFVNQPPDARLDFVTRNGLCFRCMRSGHGIARCRSLEKCDVCQTRHHNTLLHENYQERDNRQETTQTQAQAAATTPLMNS